MTQASVTNPDFFDFCPDDGWFVELKVDKDGNAELLFGLRVEQVIRQHKVINQIKQASPVEIGALKRKLILLEGVAEFLNAGGTPMEIPFSIFTDATGINFDGWHYFDTWTNRNGNRVHEFVNDVGDKFVRWVRYEYVDANLTDLKETTNDDEYDPA